MVSFENFVKSMPPSLSELKVIPSFCFAFKIPDDVTVTKQHSLSEANRHLRQAYHRVMVKLKTTGWIFFQDFFQSAISIAHKNFRNLRGARLFPTRQNSESQTLGNSLSRMSWCLILHQF